jgi:4-amino-4-deoxychorismate lyase
MAAATLDSHDGLLAHKTTRRRIYEQARAEHLPENIQEVILANQRGEICEGTITNIFVRPRGTAHLLTPPVECGLLPGVLRSELLEYGQVREELIRPGDLENAEEIFVGNSLRGLLRASLVSG